MFDALGVDSTGLRATWDVLSGAAQVATHGGPIRFGVASIGAVESTNVVQIIKAATSGVVTLWTLVGPVVGGVLGATLAARNARRVEEQRMRSAIAAEHRHANREAYIALLSFTTETVGDYARWAFWFGVHDRLTTPHGVPVDPEVLRNSEESVVEARKRIESRVQAGQSQATIVRATADPKVADRLDTFMELLTRRQVKFNLPQRALRGVEDFPELDGDARTDALDRRIGELDEALVGLRDVISEALVTRADVTVPARSIVR